MLQILFILHFGILSLASGQLFDFLVTRPSQDNLLVFRCENSEGPVRNPIFYRDGEPIRVISATNNNFNYHISRQLEGSYTCGSSDAVSLPRTLVAWPDSNCPDYTENFSGKAGSTVRLDCSIPPGVVVEQYYVTWKSASDRSRVFYESFPPHSNMGNNPISVDSQRYSVDSRNFSLSIHNATPADQNHKYLCILGVEDPHPDFRHRMRIYSQTESKNLSLSILQDPSFVAEPEGKVAIKGESVNFTCSTTSSPRPAHINWLHKDRSVRTSHADNRYITEESTEVSGSFIFSSTLTLHDVSGEDSGFVECRSAGDSKDIFSLATLDVLDVVEEFNPIPLQSGGFVYDVKLKASLQVPVKLVLSYIDVSGEYHMNYTSQESYFNSRLIKHIADSDRVPFDKFRVQVALMYNSRTMGPFLRPDNVYSRAPELTGTDISLTTIIIILVSVGIFFVFLVLLPQCLYPEHHKMLKSRLKASCTACFHCKPQDEEDGEQRREPDSDSVPKSIYGFTEKTGKKHVKCFIDFVKRDEILHRSLYTILASSGNRNDTDEVDGRFPSSLQLPQAIPTRSSNSQEAVTRFSYEVIEAGNRVE